MWPMARRLVMLFAITSWVSASRWVDRAPASSALMPSSAIHCSRESSGGNAPRVEPQLQQEAGDEERSERRGILDELVERLAQLRRLLLGGGQDPSGPFVGLGRSR